MPIFQKSFLSAKHSGEAPHLTKLGFGRALFFVFRTAEIFLVTISQKQIELTVDSLQLTVVERLRPFKISLVDLISGANAAFFQRNGLKCGQKRKISNLSTKPTP